MDCYTNNVPGLPCFKKLTADKHVFAELPLVPFVIINLTRLTVGVCMKVRFKSKVTIGFSFSPLRDSCSPLRGSLVRRKIKKTLWDQGSQRFVVYWRTRKPNTARKTKRHVVLLMEFICFQTKGKTYETFKDTTDVAVYIVRISGFMRWKVDWWCVALQKSQYTNEINTLQHGKCFVWFLFIRWYVSENSLVRCAHSFVFWYYSTRE